MLFVPSPPPAARQDLADARYFEPLGVDDLARAAGFSRAHFSREFRLRRVAAREDGRWPE